jgi:Threonine dehydrogenase and related Zn-dependent dehydrogenases
MRRIILRGLQNKHCTGSLRAFAAIYNNSLPFFLIVDYKLPYFKKPERGFSMKKVIYHGIRDIRVEEVEEPQPGKGEVKIKIKYCGICGSDLHIFMVSFPRAHSVMKPAAKSSPSDRMFRDMRQGSGFVRSPPVLIPSI